MIHPVILSGGSGTRLWPLSRSHYPKQFLALDGDKSMLQETALRVQGEGFADPIIICNEEHRFLVAEQMREIGVSTAAIVLEPVGRNTAPAAVVAALLVDGGEILVLPSDHVVRDVPTFHDALKVAELAAQSGQFVTFGIIPDSPETGYGYIQKGNGEGRVNSVARFVEKPDLENAQRFVLSGEYLWNSGMFLFPVAPLLEEIEVLTPGIRGACEAAVKDGVKDLDFLRLGKEAFEAVESISIDYALMEKTTKASVVPVDMGWSDVGAWTALWDIEDKDANGNVIEGDVLALDTKNAYLRSSGPMLATVGLDDVVIVATPDAVLVANKNRVQEVKTIVESLKADGRCESDVHTTVYRPWGSYAVLNLGENFQVKLIEVKPGATLSLQRHQKRAEHWVVVEGEAKVTRGEDVFCLRENESTFIPLGEIHRLENPGNGPLKVIEVQSGSYLGEDDIERFEDTYGRG